MSDTAKTYSCSDCGRDAFVAYSDFWDLENNICIVKKGERLCGKCFDARRRERKPQ